MNRLAAALVVVVAGLALGVQDADAQRGGHGGGRGDGGPHGEAGGAPRGDGGGRQWDGGGRHWDGGRPDGGRQWDGVRPDGGRHWDGGRPDGGRHWDGGRWSGGYGWGPSFGLYFGAPWYWGAWDPWPWYGQYRYYGYPSPSVTYGYYGDYGYEPPSAATFAPPPSAYVERPAHPVVPSAERASTWFYCKDPAGYYPYVPSCRESWISVTPPPAAPAKP
jgi:hypothetical protein